MAEKKLTAEQEAFLDGFAQKAARCHVMLLQALKVNSLLQQGWDETVWTEGLMLTLGSVVATCPEPQRAKIVEKLIRDLPEHVACAAEASAQKTLRDAPPEGTA